MNDKKNIIIVDAYNMFLKNYLVVSTIDPKGELNGGVRGFLRSLQYTLHHFSASKIIVVWDGKGGSKRRRDFYKEYKEGRRPLQLNRRFAPQDYSPEEIEKNRTAQLYRTINYLNHFPVIQFMIDDIEADDVISFLCLMEEHKGQQKLIVSKDRDFLQLCSNEVSILHGDVMCPSTVNSVINKYSIHPNNFALARSIAGDQSDNIKGVRGVGLKSLAAKCPLLIREETVTIDELLDYCQEKVNAGGKALGVYQKLLEGRDIIKNNYVITQLYMPTISIQNANSIRRTISSYEPTFPRQEVVKMMLEDGFLDINWDRLFASFTGVIFFHKTGK